MIGHDCSVRTEYLLQIKVNKKKVIAHVYVALFLFNINEYILIRKEASSNFKKFMSKIQPSQGEIFYNEENLFNLFKYSLHIEQSWMKVGFQQQHDKNRLCG